MSGLCHNISHFLLYKTTETGVRSNRPSFYPNSFIYLKYCNFLPWQMQSSPTDLPPECSTKRIFLTHLPMLLHLCVVCAKHSSYLQSIKPKLLTPTAKDTLFAYQPSFTEKYLLPIHQQVHSFSWYYKTECGLLMCGLPCWPVLFSFLAYKMIELLKLEETSKTILYHAMSPFKHFEVWVFPLLYIMLVLGLVPC